MEISPAELPRAAIPVIQLLQEWNVRPTSNRPRGTLGIHDAACSSASPVRRQPNGKWTKPWYTAPGSSEDIVDNQSGLASIGSDESPETLDLAVHLCNVC